MKVTAELIGDKALLIKMDQLSPNISGSLSRVMKRLSIEVQGAVMRGKLSGQVLKNRSGHLRSSINYVIDENQNGITATVGTKEEYAARHEYGFSGSESVKAHMRRNRAQIAKATRQHINAKGVMVTKISQTGKYGKKSGTIEVRAHTRNANTPERSYLRSTLTDMAGTIREQLQAALEVAIK